MSLPKDPQARAIALVERSLPNPTRPPPAMISPEAYKELCASRNTRAVMYASMEDSSDRIRSLAEEIESSGVVVDIVEPDEEDSLVQSISALEDSLDEYDVPVRRVASAAR